MNRIFIVRNNQHYGPYEPNILASYIEDGKILKCDEAYREGSPADVNTVEYFLTSLNVRLKIKHNGGLLSQIKDIGRELIIPNELFSKSAILKDKRLLLLAILGLSPAFLIRFTLVPFLTFYTISLYFSVIWGLFFYYFFKTSQVKVKVTIAMFFLLQVIVFVIWDIVKFQQWPFINSIFALTDSSNIFLKLIGYVFGVGLSEELVKALPLLYIIKRAKAPLIPQTMVFYGLMSGIAFGVFEGVQYQMTINAKLDYANAFFMNVARLTSLPFLHAIWAGTAGYFISFATLYPKYRLSLYFLAIFIPATIHGLYDVLGWSYFGLALISLSVILLMSYLKQGVNYQSKLSK